MVDDGRLSGCVGGGCWGFVGGAVVIGGWGLGFDGSSGGGCLLAVGFQLVCQLDGGFGVGKVERFLAQNVL